MQLSPEGHGDAEDNGDGFDIGRHPVLLGSPYIADTTTVGKVAVKNTFFEISEEVDDAPKHRRYSTCPPTGVSLPDSALLQAHDDEANQASEDPTPLSNEEAPTPAFCGNAHYRVKTEELQEDFISREQPPTSAAEDCARAAAGQTEDDFSAPPACARRRLMRTEDLQDAYLAGDLSAPAGLPPPAQDAPGTASAVHLEAMLNLGGVATGGASPPAAPMQHAQSLMDTCSQHASGLSGSSLDAGAPSLASNAAVRPIRIWHCNLINQSTSIPHRTVQHSRLPSTPC